VLTRDDLKGRKAVNAAYLRMTGGEARVYAVEGIERLTAFEQRGHRTWSVDGRAVRDLDAALDVLNGVVLIDAVAISPAPHLKAGDRVQSPAGFLGRITRIADGVVHAEYHEKGRSSYGVYDWQWFALYGDLLKKVEVTTNQRASYR
jgi:hypothetical protein